MRTRSIGSLDVTVVGIGCNNFGRELDRDATQEIVHAALDAGISFFDTADSYGKPKTMSETLLGEILKPHRDKVIIATKFGRVLDEQRFGASPAYVRSATEASLRRLQTDRIDLMQLHIPDPATPIEDTLGVLEDLVREGKIREIGNSNLPAPELRTMTEAAEAKSLPCFVSTQFEYNILHRRAAAGVVAECERSGVRLLPFRPLSNGLLTGKYRPGEPLPAGTRIGNKDAARQAEIMSPQNMAAVGALMTFAEARGHSLLELAFAWLLAHDIVPSIIAGVSSPRQVMSNAKATEWQLSPSDMTEIDGLLAQAGV